MWTTFPGRGAWSFFIHRHRSQPPFPLPEFVLARRRERRYPMLANWHHGKRGNDMADKRSRRSGQQTETLASSGVVKVTIRLDELVAKRLGVESVMTGESQSDIANRVLGAYLSGWRLPSKVGGVVLPAENAENAA
jgi:hypothetical protein